MSSENSEGTAATADDVAARINSAPDSSLRTEQPLEAWMSKRGSRFPHAWQDRLIQVDEESLRLKYFSQAANGEMICRGEMTIIGARPYDPRPLLALQVEDFAEHMELSRGTNRTPDTSCLCPI